MSTIVVFNVHHAGHLAPLDALVKQFIQVGQDVAYFVPAPAVGHVRALGASPRYYLDDPHWDFDQAAVEVALSLGASPDSIVGLPSQVMLVTLALLEFCTAALKEIKPSLVVYDAACAWARLAAQAAQIPAVSSCSSAIFSRERAHQYFQCYLDSPKTAGLFQAAAARLVELHGVQYDPRHVYCNYESAYGATLVWSVPELNPRSEDHHARYVGPSLALTAPAHDFPLERLKEQATRRALVLYSMGTVVGNYLNLTPLHRAVAEAFSRAPDILLVMSVGKGMEALLEDWERPPGVEIFEFVPQLCILEVARAFVTHGGNNSFNEALLCAVPLLVCPLIGDQFINGDIVRAHGLGRVIAQPGSIPPTDPRLRSGPGSAPRSDAELVLTETRALLTDASLKPRLNVLREALLAQQRASSIGLVSELLDYAKKSAARA